MPLIRVLITVTAPSIPRCARSIRAWVSADSVHVIGNALRDTLARYPVPEVPAND